MSDAHVCDYCQAVFTESSCLTRRGVFCCKQHARMKEVEARDEDDRPGLFLHVNGGLMRRELGLAEDGDVTE